MPLKRGERGYFSAVVAGVEPGSHYFYRLNGQQDFPDPASRFQPQGVHGPSQVAEPGFSWGDGHWSGLPLNDYVIYELHVGTFTPEGTFDAIIPHLDELKNLGITALELMPVAQFPGGRNWGYDGVYPFAVQNSYGGPYGLKRLVDACHQRGLAVVLDVVYNHLGPEGNYLANYGPYFTQRYHTPWGPALNFDGPDSDEVRRFFIDNALFWISEYHIDALRLDALDAIVDLSPLPFVAELAATVRRARERWNRKFYLMAESDLNDVRLVRSPDLGGYGLDGHWNDDFHHALAYLADRGADRLLCGFRTSGAARQGLAGRVHLFRGIFAASAPSPRLLFPGYSGGALGGLFPKPRPGGKSPGRRASQSTGFLRGLKAGRRCGALVPFSSPPVHGGGIWRNGAVLVFCQSLRSGPH